MTNGELDLKSAVEATFGPGAFELLADEGDADSEVGEQIESATCQVTEQLPPANEASTELARELFLFELADRLFAVSVSNVREVQREPPITRIPQVPCWVCGVTNLRGTIISVVDLRLRVGLDSPQRSRRRMIVVHSSENDVTTGLLVDRVLGIRAVPNAGEPSTDPFADFVSEWRQSDTQHVAVLDLDKAIDLNRPNQGRNSTPP